MKTAALVLTLRTLLTMCDTGYIFGEIMKENIHKKTY